MLRIAGGPAMRSGELCGQSTADAKSKIKAGADLVQIYTGLIYRGPGLVPKIGKALKGWRPAGRRQR